MPDHWHALIWPHSPLTISRVVHDVKLVMANGINRRRATTGPVWQRQFWDRFVRNAKEFAQRLEYMHFNPVRKGLVGRPEEWCWSSYNNFSLEPHRITACPLQVDYVRFPDDYRA